MSSILRGRGAGNKRKMSKSLITSVCQVKSGSNNSLVSCKSFNKGQYGWAFCKSAHKCTDYGSKKHKQAECILKERQKSWQYETEGIRVTKKQVEIVEIPGSIVSKNAFYKFMHVYPYLSVPLTPMTLIKFRLANVFKPPFNKFSFLPKANYIGSIFDLILERARDTSCDDCLLWSWTRLQRSL